MATKKKEVDPMLAVDVLIDRVFDIANDGDETAKAQALVHLKRIEKRIGQTVDKLKAATTSLEEVVSNHMKGNGVTSMRIDGASVQVKSSVFINKAADVEMDVAVAAMKKAKLGALCGEVYNSSSLRAWFKERVEAQNPGEDLKSALPESLRALFNVHQEFKVVIVGA